MKKILIATDSWNPELNGVVTTIDNIIKEGLKTKIGVDIIHPGMFLTVGCPTYNDIRLSIFPRRKVRHMMENNYNAIHLVDEGPICFSVRNYCIKHRIPFTSSFHTNIPEYVNCRFGIPSSWFYRISWLFHRKSERVMVPTKSVISKLALHGFTNTILWTRGVDVDFFKPYEIKLPYEKPIYLFVGRISLEKNLEAFLSLELPGTKILVGPGPLINKLSKKYPDAKFLGRREGKELVDLYAGSDVFVFPSKRDVFGLSQIEALACGTPVAAFPAPGPIDILNEKVGSINKDLYKSISSAMKLCGDDCRKHAKRYSWKECADIFFSNLAWL